jgi:hypothetical protein
MRTAKDPNYRVDWSGWADATRHATEMADMAVEMKDEFNAMVSGPWMKRWE